MTRTLSDMPVEAPGQLEPGAMVDDLRVERVLAVGPGGATLVQALTPEGERVALKLLTLTTADPEQRERFLSLVDVRASIEHPHVVPLLAAGEHEGRFYLVSELPAARTLADRLGEGVLPPADAMRVGAGVAMALDAAAEKGLVHAELSPQAILLARDQPTHALLTDFGIGRRPTRPQNLRMTVEAADYRSPEEVRGEPLQRESNAYSLACVLYECLTGAPPYPFERPLLTLHAHLVEPPPRITARRPDLPSALDEVFACALAKDPAQRLGAVSLVRAAAGALAVPVEVRSAAEAEEAEPRKRRHGLLPRRPAAWPRRGAAEGLKPAAPDHEAPTHAPPEHEVPQRRNGEPPARDQEAPERAKGRRSARKERQERRAAERAEIERRAAERRAAAERAAAERAAAERPAAERAEAERAAAEHAARERAAAQRADAERAEAERAAAERAEAERAARERAEAERAAAERVAAERAARERARAERAAAERAEAERAARERAEAERAAAERAQAQRAARERADAERAAAERAAAERAAAERAAREQAAAERAERERAAAERAAAKRGRAERRARKRGAPAPAASKSARPMPAAAPSRRRSHVGERRIGRMGRRATIVIGAVALLASGVGGFTLGSTGTANEPAAPAKEKPQVAKAELEQAAYVRSVGPVIDRLSARRAAARRKLTRARLPDSQADAATSLVDAYADARRALSADPPASLEGIALRDQLLSAERAYRRLAAAARSENAAAWRSASKDAVEQERRFERSLRSLTTA